VRGRSRCLPADGLGRRRRRDAGVRRGHHRDRFPALRPRPRDPDVRLLRVPRRHRAAGPRSDAEGARRSASVERGASGAPVLHPVRREPRSADRQRVLLEGVLRRRLQGGDRGPQTGPRLQGLHLLHRHADVRLLGEPHLLAGPGGASRPVRQGDRHRDTAEGRQTPRPRRGHDDGSADGGPDGHRGAVRRDGALTGHAAARGHPGDRAEPVRVRRRAARAYGHAERRWGRPTWRTRSGRRGSRP
jgi:hypothetical protein